MAHKAAIKLPVNMGNVPKKPKKENPSAKKEDSRPPLSIEFHKLIKSYASAMDALREFHLLVRPAISDKIDRVYEENKITLSPIMLGILKSQTNLTPRKSTLVKELTNIKPHGVEGRMENEKFIITVPRGNNEYMKELRTAFVAMDQIEKNEVLLNRGVLMNLTSHFEFLFSKLVQIHYRNFPDAINDSDKTLSLNDLKNLNSVEEALNCLIEEKIEVIMHKSFSDWVAFMKATLKLSMGYLDRHEVDISETFLRRNLIVHNDGVVNARYLTRLKDSKVKLGDRLEASDDYLIRAIERMEIAGILIVSELWKKLLPGDSYRAPLLNDIAYGHLRRERWSIAEYLSTFANGDKQAQQLDRLIAQINYWLSIKRQGKFESIKDEITRADYSGSEERFRLAKLALLDKNFDFFALLPHAVRTKNLDLRELNEWPLLAEIRKTDEYRKKWKSKVDAAVAAHLKAAGISDDKRKSAKLMKSDLQLRVSRGA